MNQSIKIVTENTTNPIVKTWAQFLMENEGHKFLATFIKKDGSERAIKFVPRNQYNRMMGIETTEAGAQMVRSKALRNMITIVEFYTPEGTIGVHEAIQCRTLNLATITSLKIAA